MGRNNFSREECVRVLLSLGFIQTNQRRGKHDKFFPPATLRVMAQPGRPPFITVPRHKDLRLQNIILHELKIMGGDALVQTFLGKV